MQLVAYGAQDVYLTGNPQITFFKVVYRRHTNFSMETVEHTLGGNPDFGRKSTVTIVRNADLATRVYLKVTVNSTDGGAGSEWGYVKRLGHALLKSAEVEIGGGKMDKQYGVWLDIWYELTCNGAHRRGYDKMIGNVPEMTTVEEGEKPEYTMYIPLQFWFCRNYGLALPLIALQYHETRLHFEFESSRSLVNYKGTAPSGISIKDACVLVDYVYLDSEERRRFASVGHEYLIEQVQFTGEESANDTRGKYKLGFNHPTKEIIWACRNGRYQGETFLGLTTDEVATELVKAQIVLSAATASVTINGGTATSVNDGGNTKIVLDAAGFPVSLLSGADPANTADVGGLYSKVTSATVAVRGTTAKDIYVTTVTHTISNEDIVPLPTMTDGRAATGTASVKGGGITANLFSNYGMTINGTGNPIVSALIQLNAHDRFDTREGAYFNYVQPFQHHSSTPADGINVYSFALNPEEHQPSGSANLSRIDDTLLNLTFAPGFSHIGNKLYIFAVSYNILRILGGLGGLAYSN